MAEKRYYWLKLKEDYFNNPKIKKLRRVAGGDTFTIIYLKMQLLSVSNKGIIEYESIEPTFEEELALKLDEDVEDVKLTLAYLSAQNLIENNENEFMLIEASKNIGSEVDSAERVRQFREREKQKMLHGNDYVTCVLQNSISISNSISNSNIYNYWNEKNIVKHKELTARIDKAITKALKTYSEEEIKKYIDRYDMVIKDETYFFDYKWTLEEFLTRKDGISSFTDEGSKWISYQNQKSVKKPQLDNSSSFIHNNYTKQDLSGLIADLDNTEV